MKSFFLNVSQVSGHGVESLSSSIDNLCDQKILSKPIAKKLVATSLTFDNLKLAYERDGFDGLRALLSEKDLSKGKPRVTKCLGLFKT